METHTISNRATHLQSFIPCSLVESLMAETAILANKFFLLLLLLVWSLHGKNNVHLNSLRTEQRFPTSEHNKMKEPDAENNDAGEAGDDGDNDDEDEDSDDNDEDDGNDSEEDSDDDEEDSDDEVVAAGYGDSDEDDDEDDDNEDDSDEDDDDDSDEDDDDDSDEDDEDLCKLPSQRKNSKK